MLSLSVPTRQSESDHLPNRDKSPVLSWDHLRRLLRDPDISFLSAFPGEAEFLFPPLTYLEPTGNVETVVVEEFTYEVVDVRPQM